MDIRLLEIEYKNIREFEDLKIDFTNDNSKVYPVSLVQMPTGTGKTTTIQLLRYVFNGRANNEKFFSSEKIKSFSPQFDTNSTKGEFKVKLKIEKEIVHVFLEMDYNNGTARYYTSKVSEEGGGKETGYNLNIDIRSLLTPSFVELFVFDGEKAQEIIDITEDTAENAIKFLYYLDRLKHLHDKIEKKIEEKRESTSVTTTQTEQGLSQIKTRLKKRRRIYKELQQEKTKLEDLIKDKKFKIKEIKDEVDEYDEIDEDLRKEILSTKNDIKNINQDIKDNTKEILTNFRNPIHINTSIINRLEDLRTKMRSLKLPRSTAKEFFEELLDENIGDNKCICGRKLDKENKKYIKEKMNDFLSAQQISIINAVKSSIRNISDEKPVLPELVYDGKEMRKKLNKKQDELGRLRVKRNSDIDEDYREKKEKKIEELKDEVKEKKQLLELITESDPNELEDLRLNWKDNLYLCKKEIDKFDKKLGEATGTIDFTKKARILKRILDNIQTGSLEKLKEEIKEKTNNKTKRILNRDDILVEKISKSLEIEGHTGVSEGQTLSIAYAFLSSLFEKSPHNLPFIVDTPAGPLDLEVRAEVAELLPELFDQLVIFITSAEKPSFGEKFYDRKNVRFMTVWKDKQKNEIRFDDTPKFFKEFHENGG